MKVFFLVAAVSFFSLSTFAKGGGLMVGASFGFVNATQTDMDTLITAANANGTIGPISTSTFGNALEAAATIGYRFDGTPWALHFQPSYFFSSETGTNTGGAAFDYSVNGLVAMPTFRVYALENDFMSLFFSLGVGYAHVTGEIKEDAETTDFSGNALGYQAGMGILICFTDNHCMQTEGHLRLMDAERTIVGSTTSAGTGHASGQLTQTGAGSELEINGRDFEASLSGVQIMLGYMYKF